MIWGTLLAAIVVGNPPTYVVYQGPEYCCLPAWPAPVIVYEVPHCVQTIPSAALALVPVPVDPPTTTAAVVQDNSRAKPTDEAVTEEVKATEEEEEDSVLEDAAFGAFGNMPQRALDHLSLGWGVSTIGNGTLYPTPFGANYAGGFGGWGGGTGDGGPFGGTNTGANWNMINNVLPPITINCNCPPTPSAPKPTEPNEVPEPTSLAAWAVAAVTAGWLRRRRTAC